MPLGHLHVGLPLGTIHLVSSREWHMNMSTPHLCQTSICHILDEVGDFVSFNITQGYIDLLVVVLDPILQVLQPTIEFLSPFLIFFLISIKDQRFLQQRFPFQVISDHDRGTLYRAGMLRSVRISSVEIKTFVIEDAHGLHQDFLSCGFMRCRLGVRHVYSRWLLW